MHLIVTVHGMWGVSSHMNSIVHAINAKLQNDTIVYNSDCNSFFNTYHGIDYCGLRLKNEVVSFVASFSESNPNRTISKISFIGYSAGGLMARYCIGLLYAVHFFEDIKPIHFITLATPHLGIRWNSRHFSGRFFNAIADIVVNIYAGRTGTQLALVDTRDNYIPLLLEMTTPHTIYYEAWKLFEYKYVYSNASNDNIVPFCTSSLSVRNKWRDVDFKKFFSDAGNPLSGRGIDRQKYSVSLLECERIDLDDTEIVYRKPRECKFSNAVYIIMLFTILLPLGVVHALIIMIPLRLVSLCIASPPAQHLPARTRKSDVEESSGSGDRDACPWLILNHARTLPIHRVAVYIPGVHTHALIICRRVPNPGGMEVITHLVDEVLVKMKPGGNNAYLPPADESATSTKIPDQL